VNSYRGSVKSLSGGRPNTTLIRFLHAYVLRTPLSSHVARFRFAGFGGASQISMILPDFAPTQRTRSPGVRLDFTRILSRIESHYF